MKTLSTGPLHTRARREKSTHARAYAFHSSGFLPLQAACWSPCGRVLLFCTTDEPIVFALTFPPTRDERSAPIGGAQVAVAVADLSVAEFETEEGPIRFVCVCVCVCVCVYVCGACVCMCVYVYVCTRVPRPRRNTYVQIQNLEQLPLAPSWLLWRLSFVGSAM